VCQFSVQEIRAWLELGSLGCRSMDDRIICWLSANIFSQCYNVFIFGLFRNWLVKLVRRCSEIIILLLYSCLHFYLLCIAQLRGTVTGLHKHLFLLPRLVLLFSAVLV